MPGRSIDRLVGWSIDWLVDAIWHQSRRTAIRSGRRTNLVGRVAICHDTIGTDDHCIDLARAHQSGCHRVGDQGRWNAIFDELGCCQSSSLHERLMPRTRQDSFDRQPSSRWYVLDCTVESRCSKLARAWYSQRAIESRPRQCHILCTRP